jgi:hypothetical protein
MMTKGEFRLAKTPHGQKVHVIATSPSMLARGTPDASDYSSLCGQVPSEWDEVSTDPAPGDICKRCADRRPTDD